MGNISLNTDKSCYDFSHIEKIHISKKNVNNNNKYNSSQKGSHSIGISKKIGNNKFNKKMNSDREKENADKISRDSKDSNSENINSKIFKMIFSVPYKNKCYLRKSCRDSSKLRLRKEEKKNFYTNLLPSKLNFDEVLDENTR
jgi:hypothetical protein